MGTKEDILKAATDIFTEKGFAGTRMQEIADKANVNKAMLHYYFTNKDHLYDETVRTVLREVVGTAMSALKQENLSAMERFSRFIDGYIDTVSCNPHLVGFVMHDFATGAKKMTQIIRETQEHNDFVHAEPAVQMMSEGMKSGELRAMDPHQTMISLIGMSLFYFVAEPVVVANLGLQNIDRREMLERRKQNIKQIFFTGILADPSAYNPCEGRNAE